MPLPPRWAPSAPSPDRNSPGSLPPIRTAAGRSFGLATPSRRSRRRCCSARLVARLAYPLDSSQGTFEKTRFQAAPSQFSFQTRDLGLQFPDSLRLRILRRCRIPVPRCVSIGCVPFASALPQVQRPPTHAQFLGQLADILAMLHPLYGIPLKSHGVPIGPFVRLFFHDTLHFNESV